MDICLEVDLAEHLAESSVVNSVVNLAEILGTSLVVMLDK